MKQILVITWFYPPCNLTPSYRAKSWADHLPEHGYQPTILTRRWDNPVKEQRDMNRGTGKETFVETENGVKVIRVPYVASLRDRLLFRTGFVAALLRKGLTMLEMLLQNVWMRQSPYRNVYREAVRELRRNPEIKLVLITGNPFNMFRFGYLLKKRFGVQWIADYRDPWTTSEIDRTAYGPLRQLTYRADRYFEKRWVGTASLISSVTSTIVERLSAMMGVPGITQLNGFADDAIAPQNERRFDQFTVVYVGALYPGQPIELFCEAFKTFIQATPDAKARFLMPGMAYNPAQHARVKAALQGYEDYVECTPRMPRQDILEIERRAHLLLHVAWPNFKGITSSKIYEYLASGTRILVTPSDHADVAEILEDSGCGVAFDDVDEVVKLLKEHYSAFLNDCTPTNDTSDPALTKYSRRQQVEQFARHLNQLT